MKTSILFIFTFFLLPIQPIQQDEDLRQRTIIVIVIDADGNPAVGKTMEIGIRKPLTRVECTTDVDGRCGAVFESNEDLVNGLIFVIGAGRHPILFKGDSVEIQIQLSEDGLINLPKDVHSEPPPTVVPVEAVSIEPITEADVAVEAVELTEMLTASEVDAVTETDGEGFGQSEPEAILDIEGEGIIEPVIELTVVAQESVLEASDGSSQFAWVWWLLAILFVGLLGGLGWFFTKQGVRS